MPKKIEVQLKMQDKLSKVSDKARGKIQQFIRTFDNLSKRLINLRNIAVGAIIAKLGSEIIGAASKIEVFGNQLRIVEGNAATAAKKLDQIREFARTSPLETEDVVQAYVRLRAVGIRPTMDEMRNLGGVAVLMNKEMTEVLDAFIGLNKRTLRRLGIDIDRTGQKAIIKSGQIKKVVEKDNMAIRDALLEVWAERFPNAIEEASKTTVAKTAIMRSEVFELAATVGKKLKPAWDLVVVSMGKAAALMRDIISYDLDEKVKDLRLEIKELRAEAEGGVIVKAGGIVGSVTKARAQLEIETKIKENRIELLRLAMAPQLERKQEELMQRNEEAALLEEKRIEAAEKAAKAAADRIKKEDEAREKQNLKNAKWLDDQVALSTEKEFELMQIAMDKERGITEITREEWEERNRIQSAALNIYKSQAQIAFEEELAILEMKKQQFPMLEEEIQRLINNVILKYDQEKIESKKRYVLGAISATNNLANNLIAFSQQERTQDLQTTRNKIASMNISEEQKEMLLAKAEKANREAAKKEKAIALAMAVVNTAVTVTKAWTATPYPPINAALAAIAAAAGAVQIATIASQKLARGTSHARGGSYIVGEEGPERVTLPSGARVQTAAMTRNSIGAVSISPTIIINGNASGETVSQIRDTLDDFSRNFTTAMRRGYIQPKSLGFQMS